MILLISTIILTLGTVLFCAGLYCDTEGVAFTGFVFIAVSVVLGFAIFGNTYPVSQSEQKLDYILGLTGAFYDSKEFGVGKVTDYEIVEKLKAGQELYIIYQLNSYNNNIGIHYKYEARLPRVEKE